MTHSSSAAASDKKEKKKLGGSAEITIRIKILNSTNILLCYHSQSERGWECHILISVKVNLCQIAEPKMQLRHLFSSSLWVMYLTSDAWGPTVSWHHHTQQSISCKSEYPKTRQHTAWMIHSPEPEAWSSEKEKKNHLHYKYCAAERVREKQWDTSGVWKSGIIAHIIHIRLVPSLCPLIVPAHFIYVEVSAAGAAGAAGGGYAPLQASALWIYRKGVSCAHRRLSSCGWRSDTDNT